jgi:Site-specific recombinase XerD
MHCGTDMAIVEVHGMKGMSQTVEPIRDKKKIEKMKQYLRKQNERDYVLFVLGINSGMRISDLLKLKAEDVRNKDRIVLVGKRGGQSKSFPLSGTCRLALKNYLDNADGLPGGWLFPSRKGGAPITRVQAYRILNEAAKGARIKENIGTHTLRKTFGYHAYRQGVDISLIMRLLNHNSPSVTKRYIGIVQEGLDSVHINLNL